MTTNFEADLIACLSVLRQGGIILYPTDTVWGLGCDATSQAAVKKIFALKQREESKSLIVLMADEKDIRKHIADPDPLVFSYLKQQTKPTTVIFDGALDLAPQLIHEDGSLAIRLTADTFCRHLIKRLRAPLVSTSANISGMPSPATFSEISADIITKVDYVVRYRQDDPAPATPSTIVRWNKNSSPTIIRK